jgi:muramoyltetrapeptide carboxypeptidase LdcA involved in peptidoglycan recycling
MQKRRFDLEKCPMQKPLYPSSLKPDDTIGFFSPSGAATHFAPKRFERAQAFFKRRGFQLRPGSLTGKNDFYRSASIRERADEFNQLIRDPQVRCVMSVVGGMNSNSLLPYVDYQALRQDPKIIIGYSDLTALLLGIYRKTGLVIFYGPAFVASFGEFPPLVNETFQYFKQMLCDQPPTPFTFPQPASWTDEFINWEDQDRPKTLNRNEWLTILPGQAEGRLIGGNLNTLLGIWGSPYMPEILAGDILFIEDSLKDAAAVERSFAHLKINGVLDEIGGIILGKHEKFDHKGSLRKPYEILLEVLAGRQVPLLADFDCCHTHPMLTMPLGLQVRLDATRREVRLLEPWLADQS